jgi:hypothetical protein
MEWQKKKKGLKIIYKALDRTQKIEQHELGEGKSGTPEGLKSQDLSSMRF